MLEETEKDIGIVRNVVIGPFLEQNIFTPRRSKIIEKKLQFLCLDVLSKLLMGKNSAMEGVYGPNMISNCCLICSKNEKSWEGC